jgi:transcriptional regulator with XRE-family HTH domain
MTRSTDNEPRLKLEQYLGIQLKRQRQAQGLKIADVARIAGISQGMLSKIENAQVSTSLDSLSRLCDVLGMPMSKLFSQYDQQGGSALLVKKGEGMEVVRRGTEKGHTYHLLNHTRGPKKSFEAYMITMDDASGLRRGPAFADGPGARFLWADGEIGLQAEELVARVNEAVEARLFEALHFQEFGALIGGEDGHFSFDLGRDNDSFGAFLLSARHHQF